MLKTQFFALYLKEFRHIFNSLQGYLSVSLFVFLAGYLAFDPAKGSFFEMGQAIMDSYFVYFPWLFVVFVPAISMNIWADEKKSATVEILFSLPISLIKIVMAKYLACLSVVAVAIFLTFPMVITIYYLGSPDHLVIFSGYLGAILVAAAMLSVSCFLAALFNSQIISFILGFSGCMILLNLASANVLDLLSLVNFSFLSDLLIKFSFLNHYDNFVFGIISLSDLWFFVVTTVTMIISQVMYLDLKN